MPKIHTLDKIYDMYLRIVKNLSTFGLHQVFDT
nr:MAG TPA: hypothetical protein [Caudoviricetes sp.]